MGNYLNSMSAYTLYSKAVGSPYFADKTDILDQIIPRIETTENYICITRPRRFGKTIMANMITSFLSKGCDARSLFENLKIASSDCYERNINKHNVIFISFNEIPRHCKSYEQYIDRIEGKLIKDLKESYPDVEIDETDAVWDVFKSIYNADNTARFIFVLDEWDYIFRILKV